MSKQFIDKKIEKLISEIKFQNSENDLIRLPSSREARLLEHVKSGRYQEITLMNYNTLESFMGITTSDQKKKFEYYTVAFIALASRAAIAGGLREEAGFDISDALLKCLAEADTIQKINEIAENALKIYAYKVYQNQACKNSLHIEKCKTYISHMIYKKITLTDISEYTKLSPVYLSALFSKEVGITLHDYIQREKIDVSCNLLRYSDSTIAEISQYMGFPSQSNFGLIFKKWKSMTPREYRQANQCTSFYTV